MVDVQSLLEAAPLAPGHEISEILASVDGLRIERIVSHASASPPDFWYDQDETEWVLVVSGRARLRFEHRPQPIELGPGDHVEILPHVRHRVDWTDPDEVTIWLAVFYHQ